MDAELFTCCLLLSAWILSCNGLPTEPRNVFFVNLKDTAAAHADENRKVSLGCEYLDVKDVTFLNRGNVLVNTYNTILYPTRSYITVENVKICFNRSEELKKEILKECEMWLYEADEFDILENGTIVLLSLIPTIIEPGTYEIVDGKLHMCFSEEDYDDKASSIDNKPITARYMSIMFGKIGCSISIVALTVHLIIFCIVPPLRNLPGYNLASLCVAFLIAFSSVIIGQISAVIGLACIISGFLQLNCFLVAFFCMNAMAFDVWRSLNNATSKLRVASKNKKKMQFITYTIYSWGVPLVITVTAIILDNVNGVPSWIKPGIGDRMICWFTNKKAKIILFIIPAFALFIINGVFFVLSAVIIKTNTLKNSDDQHNQTVKQHFILYVRLGLMIGITWLISVLATLTNNNIVWLVSDFLNPLQGLFIFILFTCSPKVFKFFKLKFSHLTSKTSTIENKPGESSDKRTTNSSTLTTRETTLSSPSQ